MEPYGRAWEKEMMRFTKKQLVDLLRKSYKKNNEVPRELFACVVAGDDYPQSNCTLDFDYDGEPSDCALVQTGKVKNKRKCKYWVKVE